MHVNPVRSSSPGSEQARAHVLCKGHIESTAAVSDNVMLPAGQPGSPKASGSCGAAAGITPAATGQQIDQSKVRLILEHGIRQILAREMLYMPMGNHALS